MRGGSQLGNVVRRVKRNDHWMETQTGPIHNYELSAEYGHEGLHVTIVGQASISDDAPPMAFRIDAMLPWATLTVKGHWRAAAHWKFGHPQGLPSEDDLPGRPRNPRALNDLLIAAGLTWAYFKGQLSFTPERGAPAGSPPPHEFVSIHIEENFVSFQDTRKLDVLDTGFVRAFVSSRHLKLTMFDRGKLESIFRQESAVSIELAGSALGQTSYSTGYGEEPGDPLGRIQQALKTVSIRMHLNREGLSIAANGNLQEFDPVEFARHKAQRNSRLQPLRAYAVHATIPWALLVARELSFANRMHEFYA